MNKGKVRKNSKKNYPVIECLEARIGTNELIELGLGIVLTFFGFILPIICFLNALNKIGQLKPPSGLVELLGLMLLIFGVFGIVGIIFLVNFFKEVKMLNIIKKKGKVKTAIVYEYIDDDQYIDEYPTQIVKLLVEDKNRLIFIYYQLGTLDKPYEINSKIKIKVYKHIFKIIED